MIVLERYIQHTAKQETKSNKLKLKESVLTTSAVRSRSKSQSGRKDQEVKSQPGFIVRRNSKLASNYVNSEFKSGAKRKPSLSNVNLD